MLGRTYTLLRIWCRVPQAQSQYPRSGQPESVVATPLVGPARSPVSRVFQEFNVTQPQYYRSGEKVLHSGIVQQYGTNYRATVAVGEPFPPTQPPGGYWYYVQYTRGR